MINDNRPGRMPEIWVISDEKAGHRNQSLGVAEALGFPATIKKIEFTEESKLPNLFKGPSLKGIDIEKSDKLAPPWPDIVISTGRKTAPIARYIKQQATKNGRKCYIVQIMWPGFPAWGFDLIAVPEHDGIKERRKVIVTIGSPHRVTPEVLKREAEIWRKTLGDPKPPMLALLIGGSTGKSEFTVEHAEKLGTMISNMAITLGSSLFVTTSRRTSEEVLAKLKDIIKCPVYFHDPNKQRANPYYAFLALANAVIVTGDSISMCSEACATGKPVYIYAPDELIPEKHSLFHESLFSKGYARNLMDKETGVFVPGQIKPLNVAQQIAERIKKDLGI